uniref:Homing endonuclease LAGLIDADG domain-containing protein n=1 Tax=Panagrolaimus davidi TaxID=227884 RepID=A0A914PGP3_9BILA
MANLKRIQFFKSFFSRQNWSLPNSIIYYILKNPSTSKVYQKLIQSCKYFFAKNPILIINEKLYIAILSYLHYPKPIDLKNISSKLWIKNEINISSRNGDEGYRASRMIPKIFKCDAPRLILMKQIISFKELIFLASNVQKINLECTIVKNSDGSIVEFKKMVEFFPKVESFI